MASTISPHAPGTTDVPERAYEMTYTAVVFCKGTPVLDGSYSNQSERRDAVVAVLRNNDSTVPSQEVETILATFGGAGADEALSQIVWLYAESGVDVHLGEHLRDVGPAILYSVFTDYGDGSTFAEHYDSRQKRLTELRQRASNLAEGGSVEFFDSADETTCLQVVKTVLTPDQGCIHLFEAERQSTGGSYVTYASEA